MKKPLPVKIVEALGWVYVALAVLSLLPMSKVMRLESSLYISSLPIAMLIGMVVALRKGRRTLFLLGNTVVMLLILLGLIAYSRVSANVYTIVGCIVCSMFLVAPFVLLYLPVSNRWYFELGDFGLSIRGIAVFVAVCLVVGFLVGLPEMGCCRMMAYRSKSHELSMLGRSLLACMAEANPNAMLLGTNAFTEFKGAFAENYVLQQMKATLDTSVYYYSKDNSTMEVDFLFQTQERVVPTEVKAEENVKSKSLSFFINEDFKNLNLKGLRCSMKPYIDQGWMENIPLYAVEEYLKRKRGK